MTKILGFLGQMLKQTLRTIIDTMELSPSWERNSRPATLLWNPKVFLLVCSKMSATVKYPEQNGSSQLSLKTDTHSIPPPDTQIFQWSLPFKLRDQNYVRVPHIYKS
jgi:hypothetical protein